MAHYNYLVDFIQLTNLLKSLLSNTRNNITKHVIGTSVLKPTVPTFEVLGYHNLSATSHTWQRTIEAELAGSRNAL